MASAHVAKLSRVPGLEDNQSSGLAFGLQVESWAEKGVRKHMEDEHLIVPSLCSLIPTLPKRFDMGIYAVFDGHGGRQSATFAKQNLPVEMAEQILSLSEDVEVPFPDNVVRRVISTACQKLDGRIATEISATKDGCTAVIIVIQKCQATIATLGDAAAFLCLTAADNAIHAVPLSEAHKPWVIKEKQRVIKSGGTVENGRVNGILEVTRSIGDIPLKRYGVLCTPTFTKFQIDPKTTNFVLAGCDGFWSSWTALEAATRANDSINKAKRHMTAAGLFDHSHFDLKKICRDLVEYVLIDKKSQDNISLVCLRFYKAED